MTCAVQRISLRWVQWRWHLCRSLITVAFALWHRRCCQLILPKALNWALGTVGVLCCQVTLMCSLRLSRRHDNWAWPSMAWRWDVVALHRSGTARAFTLEWMLKVIAGWMGRSMGLILRARFRARHRMRRRICDLFRRRRFTTALVKERLTVLTAIMLVGTTDSVCFGAC